MLTPRQLDILDFEREWAIRSGNREAAIRQRFGVSPARYYQEQFAVIDHPEALTQDAVLVHRLQRLRVARRRDRTTPGGRAVA